MPIAAQTVVFIRHGLTDWNAEGRVQGQRDVPLNETGRTQAHRNGLVLAEAIPGIAGFDFVASPLCRACETMEIARAAIGLDATAYRTDDRLREITFGEWESYTLAEIRAREPGQLAAREADKWGFSPPGGESYERLGRRLRPWLDELRQPTVVVAHGGIGRVLWVELTGLDPATAAIIDIPHDKVFRWQDGSASLL